jgi:hypothetical protein
MLGSDRRQRAFDDRDGELTDAQRPERGNQVAAGRSLVQLPSAGGQLGPRQLAQPDLRGRGEPGVGGQYSVVLAGLLAYRDH